MAGWILAGWISSWVENDLGGFRLGGKWLKVWVDSGGWKTAGGKRLGGFWMGGFRLQGMLHSMSFVVLFVGCFLLYFNVVTYVETLDSLASTYIHILQLGKNLPKWSKIVKLPVNN